MAGSPEVKALGGQVDAEPPRSDHPRGQTTRRAVARANGLVVEIGSPREDDLRDQVEVPRVSFLYPMASANMEELGNAHVGSPGGS